MTTSSAALARLLAPVANRRKTSRPKPSTCGVTVTLRTTEIKACQQFYTEILGFRVSDWLGENFVWMRCTPEHHGLAVSTHERVPMMHHLAYHVKDMSKLVQQAEYLMHSGRSLLCGTGRHGLGQNLFIYFHDSEENVIEFAEDMRRIWDEENYVPQVWDPNEPWSKTS